MFMGLSTNICCYFHDFFFDMILDDPIIIIDVSSYTCHCHTCISYMSTLD